MKVNQADLASNHHCADGICETLDRLGVPRNSKWRSLMLFMRSIEAYDIYNQRQKRQIQNLLVKVLKEGGLTEEKFTEISRTTEEILSAPWRMKLQTALEDVARAIRESRGMMLDRKENVEQLQITSMEIVQSGKDLEDVLSEICQGFQDVLQYMEQDAEKLTRLSLTDYLTGLNNRRALDEVLTKEVAQAKAARTPLCAIMADVDHFKAFNDQYGHPVGDQALSAVASVIRESQRQLNGDAHKIFAARYGGEEFTIIAQDMRIEKALSLAEHIRRHVESYNFVIRNADGNILSSGIKLTISLGVASLSKDWEDELEQRLINAADQALYSAKQSGRNRVMSYSPM